MFLIPSLFSFNFAVWVGFASFIVSDGGELNVNLQKMKKADTWPAALQGSNTNVDPLTLEGMQKKIMLERFQSEVRGVHRTGLLTCVVVLKTRILLG